MSTFKICSSLNSILNPRIFVGVAAVGILVAIGIIAFSGQQFISDVSDSPREVLPIIVELEDLSIVELTDKYAVLEIEFLVSNPNSKSVILQYLKYELLEDDVRVYTSQIGERPGGFVVGSNYIMVLSNSTTAISDEIVLRNTGNTPELWSDLTENTANWKIIVEAFFNLSSMTTGGQNEVTFEFTP